MQTDICTSKHGGASTSVAAFERTSPTLTDARERVYSAIAEAGEHGANCREVAAALGVEMHRVSGRMTELAAIGRIESKAGNVRRDGGLVFVTAEIALRNARVVALNEAHEIGVSKGKPRMGLANAIVVADQIRDALRPGCDRIEIAGSVRREKETVGDIELVAIPSAVTDLFGNPSDETVLDGVLDGLAKQGRLRPIKGGPKYKQFGIDHVMAGLKLDLFLCQPENWGLIFAIRTGPWQFSKRLVTQQKFGGLLPDGWSVSGGNMYDEAGSLWPTPEEADVFEMCGGWVEPNERK